MTCETCGCEITDDVELHAQWHAKLDLIAQVSDSYPDGLTRSMARWSAKRERPVDKAYRTPGAFIFQGVTKVRARGGIYGLTCWNGLSHAQQRRLIEVGNLPVDYVPEGGCEYGAEVGIETMEGEAPGPRFYCRACAIAHLLVLEGLPGAGPANAVDGEPARLLEGA